VVNRTKSAIAASPADFRTALGVLIQGRASWNQGGVLVISDEAVGLDLLEIIAERLGVDRAKVHVGDLDQLHWSKAGKATVLVHLPAGGIPPLTVSTIEAGGGVVLRGWPDAWTGEDKANAEQALVDHQNWPRIAVPVVESKKDLGVAIGSGAAGKLQHQQRLRELFKRCKLVSGLGLPMGKRERLVASSAIPAGLYGCAAQPPDADTIDAARRHVQYALHRGSRFCQMPLFFTVGVETWRADPGAVWVWKAMEAARLLASSVGRTAFTDTLAIHTEGPIAAVKAALAWAGLEIHDMMLCECGKLRGVSILGTSKHALRGVVLQAIRARDLLKASRRGEQHGLAAGADVDECRRIIKRLPPQGMQEAAKAVATGDVVTRSQSRFWQGHDGSCFCGGGKETVKHFLWSCPFTWVARNTTGPTLGSLEGLPPFQLKLGIPELSARLKAWQGNWRGFEQSSGDWKASMIWTDASSFYPKDAALRVVGWAVVAWRAEGWAFVRGTMPPGTTVAQGEARAIQVALDRLEPGGTIASDCWAAVCLWLRARRGRGDRGEPMWDYQRAFELHPRLQDATVKWIPAHKTFQEAVEGGMSYEDWSGNGMADCFAKLAARAGGPPAELVEERAERRIKNEMVLKTAAAVLLQKLKARPRTKEDAAVKSRKRPEPGLPRRLREAKRPKCVLQRAVQEGPELADLVHVGGRVRCTAEHARHLVWSGVEPEAGLHALSAAGPWPNAGSLRAVNGRIRWSWQCSRCQARASDSSRAAALMRKICKGDHGVTMQEAAHVWVAREAGPTCSRCKLVRNNGRGAETAGKVCPVMACQKNGDPWPQGEASYASELGKVYGFRRWCEIPLVELRDGGPAEEMAAPAGVGVGGEDGHAPHLLAPARLHLACKLGRKWVCLNCFAVEHGGVATFRRARCAGRTAVGEAGRALLNAVVRYGPVAGLLGAGQARLAELWAAAGCQLSLLRPAASQGPAAAVLRLSAIGRALAGANLAPGGGSARRPREAPSQPLRAEPGGEAGCMEEEACVKRRRYGGEAVTEGPGHRGLLLLSAGGSDEVRAGAGGLLRASTLGQALLYGVRGKGRLEGTVAGGPVGSRDQGAPGALVSLSEAVQPTRLREAVSAEERAELKRRRLRVAPGLEQPCSQGARDAMAACREVRVASAVAAWPGGPRDQAGSRGSSSSGPPCPR
jgi:hypothetical protein